MKPKLLANENIPAPSIAFLREQGYDVFSIREIKSGIPDSEVLAIAVKEHRWILTFDRDYGELLFARGMQPPPTVILLRLSSYQPSTPGQLIARALATDTALEGYFVVLREDNLRKRPFPG